MKTYELTQSGPITIEKSEDSSSFTMNAVKGTWFYGEWQDLHTKGLGELVLSDGFCIPMCPKHLFVERAT